MYTMGVNVKCKLFMYVELYIIGIFCSKYHSHMLKFHCLYSYFVADFHLLLVADLHFLIFC